MISFIKADTVESPYTDFLCEAWNIGRSLRPPARYSSGKYEELRISSFLNLFPQVKYFLVIRAKSEP